MGGKFKVTARKRRKRKIKNVLKKIQKKNLTALKINLTKKKNPAKNQTPKIQRKRKRNLNIKTKKKNRQKTLLKIKFSTLSKNEKQKKPNGKNKKMNINEKSVLNVKR